MNCGIVVRHPEHARFFGRVYHYLTDRGHDVAVFVREHGHATELLAANSVPHAVLAGEASSRIGLMAGHAAFEARLLRAARRRDLDVLAAVGGVAVTHVAPLAGARSVAFVDWNRRGAVDGLVASLADVVCTPRFVSSSFGPAHRRYDGYHELAYLHPDRFTPDETALRERGVDPSEPFFVLGVLDGGHGTGGAADVASALSDRGDLYLSHESVAPDGFASTPRLPASHAPDALAFADLYVGNSGTMAAEAAVLGTPSIRLKAPDEPDPRCGELADRYELLVPVPDPTASLDAVEIVLDDPDAARAWRERRRTLLDETVDVTAFVGDLLVDEGER